jgi:hypothetical protein
VISLGSMCGKHIHKLSKTHTTCNLTIHHNKQLIPTAEEFDILVPLISLNNSLSCAKTYFPEFIASLI